MNVDYNSLIIKLLIFNLTQYCDLVLKRKLSIYKTH